MMSVTSLLQAYREKKTTPLEVTKTLFAKIKELNPKYNVYLTLNEEAALKAAEDTTEFDLPLAGVPVAVKDNFCTKDLRTTASAKLLDQFIPPYDATVIKHLKDAGAIIMGKTNMDAWAHGSSTETSDYGPTKNPYDIERVPGGSSGGSTTAVAMGLPPFAIGSETAGSIRQPAAWSGVVGLKPTYGRVSRYGVIAMGSSLDSPGPITKTVEDAALILKVLAGHDPYDATSSDNKVEDYTAKLKNKKTFTIGIADDYLTGVDKQIVQKFEETVELFKKLGHKIKKVSLLSPKYAISVYTILQRAEVSSNLCRYDGIRFGEPRSAFSEQAKRRMMLGAFTLSAGYYDAYYLKAQKVRTLIIENFKEAFKSVDLILAPTTPIPALKIGDSANNAMFGEIMDQLVEASSIAGIPGINMPVGLVNHLPVGMQIMGPWFSENNVLNLGYQYEKETECYKIKPPVYHEL